MRFWLSCGGANKGPIDGSPLGAPLVLREEIVDLGLESGDALKLHVEIAAMLGGLAFQLVDQRTQPFVLALRSEAGHGS